MIPGKKKNSELRGVGKKEGENLSRSRKSRKGGTISSSPYPIQSVGRKSLEEGEGKNPGFCVVTNDPGPERSTLTSKIIRPLWKQRGGGKGKEGKVVALEVSHNVDR